MIGNSWKRTPIASNTAFAMAGAVGTSPGSPMPLAPYGPLVPSLSTSIVVISGRSPMFGIL